MILIADSGATKVDWRLISADGVKASASTSGISPVYMDAPQMVEVLKDELLPQIPAEGVDKIYFYAAGIVSDEVAGKVCGALRSVFADAECFAASDLLAAARALCGDRPGIACILGTGSNSCFYDGEKIVTNVRAGGFILGDEASGAYFGRRLVSDFIKGLMPTNLEQEFIRRYDLDYPAIVQKVYKEPQPSKFLASFAPFISEYSNHPYIKKLIRSGFEEFLLRNVSQYDWRRYSVNFTGSIAYYFKAILERCITAAGMRLGKIYKTPIEGLVEYHKL